MKFGHPITIIYNGYIWSQPIQHILAQQHTLATLEGRHTHTVLVCVEELHTVFIERNTLHVFGLGLSNPLCMYVHVCLMRDLPTLKRDVEGLELAVLS